MMKPFSVTDLNDVTQGSCLCGDVVFEVSKKPKSLMHCHCSMCRKFHGSAFATFAFVGPNEFAWIKGEDSLMRYRSSDNGERVFCKTCGSAMPAGTQGDFDTYIPLGSVPDESDDIPGVHCFVGSKAAWHDIVDSTEQHDGWAPVWDDVPEVESETRGSQQPNTTAGSCLCGVVQYEYEGEPVRMMNCHCSRCRRQMSAAYGTFVFVSRDQFRWVEGEDAVVNYKMPEAKVKGTAFCQHCGSLVPRARDADTMQIPAGSLDDHPGMRPMANIFTDSKAQWVTLDENIPCFPEYPS